MSATSGTSATGEYIVQDTTGGTPLTPVFVSDGNGIVTETTFDDASNNWSLVAAISDGSGGFQLCSQLKQARVVREARSELHTDG